MRSKQLIKKILEKWEFPILEETEDSLLFRYQMMYVNLASLRDDANSVAAVIGRIFTVENDEEMTRVMKVCNELNFQVMQAKFFIDEDNELAISSEFFYKDETDIEMLLKTALQVLMVSKKRFRQKYEAVEAEEKLFKELNGDE